MKLTAIPCGHITSSITGGDGPATPLPIMAVLIETAGEVVLWDTGMHPLVRTDPIGYWGRIAKRRLVPQLPEGADVVSRLTSAGISPDDVTLVLNSHLHNDHAGMNLFFPNARTLVRRREWEQATAVMDEDSSGFVRGDFYDEARLPELFDYDGECDILGTGELILVSTIGHTAGHQSAKLVFGSGAEHVLTGDAVYRADQLDSGEPPAITWDEQIARESVRLLASMRDEGMRIHVCHDHGEWEDVGDVTLIHEEAGRE